MGILVDQVNENKPTENEQKCSICDRMVMENPRYKNYVCYDCQIESPPVNENNENIEFYNIDPSGGFMSKVNNIIGNDHICYIKNIKCYANESRFGGIVIIPFHKYRKTK